MLDFLIRVLIFSFLGQVSLSYGQYQLEKIIYEEDVDNDELGHDKLKNFQKIINQENIKQQIPSSVDDVLQTSIEATTTRGPRVSGEGVQVRGFDAEKIYILVDGVRQNYREGHSTMNPVDIENLKAVKIQKNSSNFSRAGSLNGGVEFITKSPKDYLKQDKNFGSEFNYKNLSANNEESLNAKVIKRKDKHSALLSVTRAEADNLKLNNGSTLDNSSFKDINAMFKYHYHNTSLFYEKYYREDDNPLNPALNPPNSEEGLQSDSIYHKDSFSLGYKKNHLTSQAYLNNHLTKRQERENKLTQRREIQTLGLNIKNKTKLLDYGLDIYQDRLSSNLSGETITDYPNAKSINAATFIERSILHGNFTITPGLQFAIYSLDAEKESFESKNSHRVLKKIHIENKINDNISLHALYSEGFNAPEVLEVYPEGLHSPGDDFILRDNYFIPNENLKHETSMIKELGLIYQNTFRDNDLFKFSTSLYQNEVNDFIRILRIDRSIADPEDGTSQFINIPDVDLFGGEAELQYLLDNWDFNCAYSFVRGKNKTEGLYLEDLPADQFKYQVKYFWEEYRLSIGYLGIHALRQNRTNPQTIQRTERTAGYFVHNAFLDKEMGEHWLISLKGNNLGNKTYRRHAAFLNEASEDFRVMIKYKWNTL
jgi:hemoglobin/transferrin/lactoferrin receptor protein